jgi:hypothetical protein
MRQLITPTPIIPAVGGWCLQYVRQAFGLEARYASATEAWESSKSQHRDRSFPPGLWTPVWYGLDTTPLGHVVLRSPDGAVYSTSDYSGWPRVHADLAELEAFYAYYGMNLTYRGWTEDVAGFAVMAPSAIATQSSTVKPAPAAPKEEFTVAEADRIIAIVTQNQVDIREGKAQAALAVRIATENQRRIGIVKDMVADVARAGGAQVDYDRIDRLFEENVAEGIEVDLTVRAAAPVDETTGKQA